MQVQNRKEEQRAEPYHFLPQSNKMAGASFQLYCFMMWMRTLFYSLRKVGFLICVLSQKVSGDSENVNNCGLILNEPYQGAIVTLIVKFSLSTEIGLCPSKRLLGSQCQRGGRSQGQPAPPGGRALRLDDKGYSSS